jgi:hypothetical protein
MAASEEKGKKKKKSLFLTTRHTATKEFDPLDFGTNICKRKKRRL